jgi:hypothetical protein
MVRGMMAVALLGGWGPSEAPGEGLTTAVTLICVFGWSVGVGWLVGRLVG